MTATSWRIAGRVLDLSRPLIMGIVNVTADSFSDGGRFLDPAAAQYQAQRLVDEGADILDIGAESTRPGATDVTADVEIRRIVPLLLALRPLGVPLSVDTSKAVVMRAALDAVRDSDCGIVLMHMQGVPRTMQANPRYDDVVREVGEFLQARVAALQEAGVAAERIVVDPGFGFGKTVAHNYTLLRELRLLTARGRPVLAGLSRKSMLGAAIGRTVEDRVTASVAAALLAVERGASIVRVHDVIATRDALRVRAAMGDEERRDQK